MLITKFRIFENVQQAKSILKSLNIDEKDKDYVKIKTWLTEIGRAHV